jgi:hypothetical protein
VHPAVAEKLRYPEGFCVKVCHAPVGVIAPKLVQQIRCAGSAVQIRVQRMGNRNFLMFYRSRIYKHSAKRFAWQILLTVITNSFKKPVI